MNGRRNERTALITGANRGIGLAVSAAEATSSVPCVVPHR